ncbi:MAG: heparinase II/III family protein, partial [Bacteroidia bacterium]|nr:heparinase II/III family protein [Bacteroidia bacterium]
DNAFSPDGYYTEGPYYQRYAMTPFMMFGQAIENNLPDLKIFEYREGLLRKAIYALVHQSNTEGEFFPINDAQKGMSIKSPSVITAVNIGYGLNADSQLLDIAALQGTVLLDQNGFALSQGMADGDYPRFDKKSIQLRDGAQGDQGALSILRAQKNGYEVSLIFKATAQGLGHGHYDKLSYLIYDDSDEVLQDYGAARWVNIDQKAGGRYLPENTSWAKQTIAHNALVVDQQSHFGGKYEIAVDKHSEPFFYDFSNPDFSISSAKELQAYPDVKMHRTVVLFNDDEFVKPVAIDIMSVHSNANHQYDLAFQYAEQLMQVNGAINTLPVPGVMGNDHGYQHVYKEGTVANDSDNFTFTWFKDLKFYTLTTLAENRDEFILARIGANDPNFNLRKDGILIHRKPQASDALFISVIESHGVYSPVSEIPIQPYSQVKAIRKLFHSYAYTALELESNSGKKWQLIVANENNDKAFDHSLEINDELVKWQGPYKMIKE